MNHLSVMLELAPFRSRSITNCIKDINEIARYHGLIVNIIDLNTVSIDEDHPRRLNVRTDHRGIIKSFTIG
jgi:hypothetical protein